MVRIKDLRKKNHANPVILLNFSVMGFKGARLAIKIDVDTERGTRVGVPALVAPVPRAWRARDVPVFARAGQHRPAPWGAHLSSGFSKRVSPHHMLLVPTTSRTSVERRALAGPHIRRAPRRPRCAPCAMPATRSGDSLVTTTSVGRIVYATMSPDPVFAEFGQGVWRVRAYLRRIGRDSRRRRVPAGERPEVSKRLTTSPVSITVRMRVARIRFFPRKRHSVQDRRRFGSTLSTLDELPGRPEYPIQSLRDITILGAQHRRIDVDGPCGDLRAW